MIMLGVVCMFLGMGTVFLFLFLLFVILQYGAVILGRYFPDEPETGGAVAKVALDRDLDIIALITAAIRRHEFVNRKG